MFNVWVFCILGVRLQVGVVRPRPYALGAEQAHCAESRASSGMDPVSFLSPPQLDCKSHCWHGHHWYIGKQPVLVPHDKRPYAAPRPVVAQLKSPIFQIADQVWPLFQQIAQRLSNADFGTTLPMTSFAHASRASRTGFSSFSRFFVAPLGSFPLFRLNTVRLS